MSSILKGKSRFGNPEFAVLEDLLKEKLTKTNTNTKLSYVLGKVCACEMLQMFNFFSFKSACDLSWTNVYEFVIFISLDILLGKYFKCIM